ncbi:MAG: NosD domain-containing protein [Desulfurococcaceae archaeon]
MYPRFNISPLCIAILLCLLCLVIACTRVSTGHFRVNEIITVYIRPNGEIEPLYAPIMITGNNTYVLLKDFMGKIVVERDNIILDGNYKRISAPINLGEFPNGVEIKGRNNVLVKNLIVENFINGIYVENSTGIEISRIISRSNKYGVIIKSSHGCVVTSSYFYNNSWTGISLANSTNSILSSNIVLENNYGISLEHSHNNMITYSNIVNNTWVGIRLSNSNNNTVENNVIESNADGITLWGSTNNLIVNNTIKNNKLLGLVLMDSHGNFISRNSMIKDSLATYRSYENVVVNNTVNNKPLIYCENIRGGVISGEAGQVILNKCSELIVENIIIDNSDIGIFSFASRGLLLRNLVLQGNEIGIVFESSGDNVVANIIAENNTHGIIINYSADTVVENSFLANNRNGLFIRYSSSILVNKNTIKSNVNGLNLYMSAFNTMLNNVIQSNRKGIIVYQSFDNLIANNDFIDNEIHVYIEKGATGNKWDIGYPGGGNYWSNYICVDEKSGVNQDEEGRDGICDTPYVVNYPQDVDRYPFQRPLFASQVPAIIQTSEVVDKNKTITEIQQSPLITASPSTPFHVAEKTGEDISSTHTTSHITERISQTPISSVPGEEEIIDHKLLLAISIAISIIVAIAIITILHITRKIHG